MSQFKNIPYIPTAEKLADLIFSKLKKIQVEPPKRGKKKRSDYSFYRTLYFRQFRFLFPELKSELERIADSFPMIDELHPFHKELIDVLFGIEKLRTNLSRIKHTKKAIESIEVEVSRKLGRSQTAEEAKRIRQEALGRVGSAIRKLEKPLAELISAKIQLSKVPDFNLEQKTIAFAGGPNAGKSSFVKLVSTGKPEIASYPFTTKELICGHRQNRFESIQLVDTPGLLDRSLHERNQIEMKSILALKYLADAIVFLYDPSKNATLTLAEQQNLFQEIKKTFPETPMYVFINKKDIIPKEQLPAIFKQLGEHRLIATTEEYKNELEEVIQTIIDNLPQKKFFIQDKKEKEPHVEKQKKTDEIEWIFFDEDSSD